VALEIRRNALLSAEIRRDDHQAVVLLSGELDASTAGQLYQQLAELIRDGVVNVALDLSALEFMDSTGLSAVIAEHKRTSASGGELVIVSPQSQVLRMFEITGLTEILHISSEEHGVCRPKDTAGEVGVS
jgi:anti-sigma B factor antagonist